MGEYNDAAPHEGMSAGEYIGSRFTTLKPAMLDLPNPIKLIRMLNRQQWAFFAVAFAAWVSFTALGASPSLRLLMM